MSIFCGNWGQWKPQNYFKKDEHREVIKNHLERLKEVNPKINAITRSLNDEAMEMAVLADEKISRNEQIGPLYGVPVTIKDNVDITGQSSPNGVSKLKDNLAPANSPVADNLLKAGAIPIAEQIHQSSAYAGILVIPFWGYIKPPIKTLPLVARPAVPPLH